MVGEATPGSLAGELQSSRFAANARREPAGPRRSSEGPCDDAPALPPPRWRPWAAWRHWRSPPGRWGAATAARAFAESAEAGQAADVGAGTDGVTAREAPPVGDDVVGPPVEPGVTEDNVFVGPGASPFLATASEPRSTFGFDVDTGSYTVGRTFLDQGLLPPAESVRTEEWVNAFGYEDPAPADDADGAAADLAVSVA